jgi:hypothetical protein
MLFRMTELVYVDSKVIWRKKNVALMGWFVVVGPVTATEGRKRG